MKVWRASPPEGFLPRLLQAAPRDAPMPPPHPISKDLVLGLGKCLHLGFGVKCPWMKGAQDPPRVPLGSLFAHYLVVTSLFPGLVPT